MLKVYAILLDNSTVLYRLKPMMYKPKIKLVARILIRYYPVKFNGVCSMLSEVRIAWCYCLIAMQDLVYTKVSGAYYSPGKCDFSTVRFLLLYSRTVGAFTTGYMIGLGSTVLGALQSLTERACVQSIAVPWLLIYELVTQCLDLVYSSF